jgi:2,4-dienoyl-CoA reductase-like NADH-dependent reductase (Old Yellow Enzyme family)
MADGRARPHRPTPYADLTALIDAAGGSAPESRAEIAAATAAVLVRVGREPSADPREQNEKLVALADRIGLDTLAELWRDADPVSLPGALWALYLLRQWCRSSADEVGRLWRAGEPIAAADAVVAGVADYVDVDSVTRVADDVLSGAYRGDFAVALERAAALFRVIAAGRRELAGADDRGAVERTLADRNERAAADLSSAARLWRSDALR